MKLSEVGKEMWDVELHTSPMGREALKSANAIFIMGNRLSYKHATGRDLLEAIEAADGETFSRLQDVNVAVRDIRDRINWLAIAFCVVSLCIAGLMVLIYLVTVVATGQPPETDGASAILKPLLEIIMIILGE